MIFIDESILVMPYIPPEGRQTLSAEYIKNRQLLIRHAEIQPCGTQTRKSVEDRQRVVRQIRTKSCTIKS